VVLANSHFRKPCIPGNATVSCMYNLKKNDSHRRRMFYCVGYPLRDFTLNRYRKKRLHLLIAAPFISDRYQLSKEQLNIESPSSDLWGEWTPSPRRSMSSQVKYLALVGNASHAGSRFVFKFDYMIMEINHSRHKIAFIQSNTKGLPIVLLMVRLPTFCHPFFNKLTKKLTANMILETSSSSVIVTFPIATPRQSTSNCISSVHTDVLFN
jgi:hypothetical protein